MVLVISLLLLGYLHWQRLMPQASYQETLRAQVSCERARDDPVSGALQDPGGHVLVGAVDRPCAVCDPAVKLSRCKVGRETRHLEGHPRVVDVLWHDPELDQAQLLAGGLPCTQVGRA